MEPFVEHLVVDAAGFIKYVKLEKLGKIIHTVREVVDEIKDKATKERLQVLPYEINFDCPTAENIKFATEFSKKTGDYGSLSATDLKVIALTYQLEKTFVGDDHLKTSPSVQTSSGRKGHKDTKTKNHETSDAPSFTPNVLPGFYKPSSREVDVAELNSMSEKLSLTDQSATDENTRNTNPELIIQDNSCTKNELECCNNGDEYPDKEHACDDDNDEDEDEEAGWITPQNIDKINSTIQNRDPVAVGCITADFAIQNVLMHIGLNVVSVDGSVIKHLRTYILRCYGCFKTTSVMTKKFCPECGNATLKRVAVTVNDNGTKNIFISKRKTINTKRFTKPVAPFRGGKHADNPILYADQPTPENRLSKKALQKLNVLDADYAARDSPFLDRDIYSRSALLGVRKLTSNKSKKRL